MSRNQHAQQPSSKLATLTLVVLVTLGLLYFIVEITGALTGKYLFGETWSIVLRYVWSGLATSWLFRICAIVLVVLVADSVQKFTRNYLRS